MSKHTVHYYGSLYCRRLDGHLTKWTCHHKHKTIEAAARCSQLASKAYMPITKSKVTQTKYESVSAFVMVDDSRLDRPMSLSSYRIYAAAGIP